MLLALPGSETRRMLLMAHQRVGSQQFSRVEYSTQFVDRLKEVREYSRVLAAKCVRFNHTWKISICKQSSNNKVASNDSVTSNNNGKEKQ